MSEMHSQKHQWILLDAWFSEKNPRKVFERFLLIHSFPASNLENHGIYYNQICRKLIYANQDINPKEWIRKRLNENALLNDADINVDSFTHEAENPTIIKNLVKANRLWLDTTTFLYRIVVALLIIMAFTFWCSLPKQQNPEWWQK
jgi:hypothetical protein